MTAKQTQRLPHPFVEGRARKCQAMMDGHVRAILAAESAYLLPVSHARSGKRV